MVYKNTTNTDVFINTEEGHALHVTVDGSSVIHTEDLSIDPCGTTLCYEDSGLNFSETALDFIVEDDPSGL